MLRFFCAQETAAYWISFLNERTGNTSSKARVVLRFSLGYKEAGRTVETRYIGDSLLDFPYQVEENGL